MLISEDRIEFTLNGRPILFYGWRHGDLGGLRDYDWLDVEGKRVLDVGASIGDSAIFFALRGAREVVAFEPYPFYYGLAVKNVEANGLSNVKVINAGISGSDGTVRVTRGETTMGVELKPSEEPDAAKVPVYSLDRVLEEHGSFDIMKMDCEGCEYDAILKSEIISELKQIQLEYHYGPERLVEALRNAGFKVEATRPRRVYDQLLSDPDMRVGYIYAERARALR